MKYRHLCLIFGITPTVCSRVINMMLKRMVQLLWGNSIARVQFPDEAKMMLFANMIQQREPMVDNIICFMDGVSFPVQCTDKWANQNAMYCGYYCNTMVNNVFVYGPDGKVFFAANNLPGSWVDGSLTTHFYITQRGKLGHLKSVSIRDFPKVEMHTGLLMVW
jgi:hypothetical protein